MNLLKTILAWTNPHRSVIKANHEDGQLLFEQARAEHLGIEVLRSERHHTASPRSSEHLWHYVVDAIAERAYDGSRQYRFRGDTVLSWAEESAWVLVRAGEQFGQEGLNLHHRCDRHEDCRSHVGLGQACQGEPDSIRRWLERYWSPAMRKEHVLFIHPWDYALVEPLLTSGKVQPTEERAPGVLWVVRWWEGNRRIKTPLAYEHAYLLPGVI